LRFFPSLLSLCPGADEPWFWDLLDLVKTPERGRRTKAASVARVLRQNRIRRVTSADVVKTLRREPLRVAPGVVDASSEHVSMLLPVLRAHHAQVVRCEKRTKELLEKLGTEPQ